MRTWTERRISAVHVAKAADVNVEASAIARVVNGNLDQHNMPLASVSAAKLVDPTVVSSAYDGTLSTYLATSSYHRTVKRAEVLTTPNVTISPEDEELSAGWHAIAPFQALESQHGSVLEFDAREGFVRGQAIFDFERRNSFVNRTDGSGTTKATTHQQDWVRLGVFLNGVLVADSGELFCCRQTVDLPFAHAAPSGYCRVELKFRCLNLFRIADGGTTDGGAVTWTYVAPAVRYPDLRFFGANLWARNQYR